MVNLELINQTMTVWQPRSNHKLSREDSKQIVENMVGFINILKEWETHQAREKIEEVRHAG